MKKTIKEMIEVMQACDEGKIIQVKLSSCLGDNWDDCIENKPKWNWKDFDYRVKPESKTRPMNLDEIENYWEAHRLELVRIDKDLNLSFGFILGVNLTERNIYVNDYIFTQDEFVKYCSKEDGTKFEVGV